MLTNVQILASYLYLLQSEMMPEEPEFNRDEPASELAYQAWCQEFEAWALLPDLHTIDLCYVERFILETEVLLQQLQEINVDSNTPAASQYMTLFYNAAKETFNHDKSQIRTYFSWLYLVLFHRNEGPRWGDFVEVYGPDNFVALVQDRFQNLIRN